MNRIVITKVKEILFLLIYEEGELVECHPLVEKKDIQIGQIYIGRVEKVVKNIQSAFIRLDEDKVGYLPLNEKPAYVLNRVLPKGLPSIAENDLILVQVEQEPQKMKQARVTGNISLSGKYVALDLQKEMIGVSKRIKSEQRINALKQLIPEKEIEYGCIFRTASECAENEEILAEYHVLKEKLDQILHKACYARRRGCVMDGKPEILSILEEYGLERIDEVKTDQKEIFSLLSSMELKVTYDKDEEYPLYKLLGLETEIAKLLNRKVWLKSGGFLIIEPTEAMVVIDVNSGKSIGKKQKEKHIFETNYEAAKEIVRQLRLRNLSGIIMIDFINMNSIEYKQKIIECLKNGLHRDKIPGYFIEITKLDLFELTRKKYRKPIHEILKYKDWNEYEM